MKKKLEKRIEDGRKFWPHINHIKPFKHKKTRFFLGQPMFPPKIHLIPTFWKLVLSSTNFTSNPNLGTKVKIEVQTRGEMRMPLWISLIWCFQQCKLSTSKSIFYYYYNFVLPTKYLCIKISLPLKLCCPKTNYVW
jgi:hypothetical protein